MNESFTTAVAEGTLTPSPASQAVLYPQETSGSHIFRLILYGLIFVFTLLGNVAVVMTVVRTKELRTGE